MSLCHTAHPFLSLQPPCRAALSLHIPTTCSMSPLHPFVPQAVLCVRGASLRSCLLLTSLCVPHQSACLPATPRHSSVPCFPLCHAARHPTSSCHSGCPLVWLCVTPVSLCVSLKMSPCHSGCPTVLSRHSMYSMSHDTPLLSLCASSMSLCTSLRMSP